MPPEDNVAEIGQSYHALYHNVQVRRAYGYGVVSGGQVSPGSTGLSVDVEGGTALFDGDRRSIPSRTDLSIPSPDASDPRKDLVVYDGTTVDVIVGTAQPAPSDQGSATRFELYQPSPPDTSTTPVVVLAELFVSAGASSLSPADVNDLRTDPSVDADRVSLPDDARLTLGDADDFTVRYDSNAARLIVETPGGNTFEYLNDGSLFIDGDLVAEGDVTFGGVFDPDTITPDVVDVGESLELPVYADNANATQDAAEVWFNDGTGPDAAGIYYFDGGVIGPLETGSGSSPGTLSGLTVDVDAKDFDGATFTGVGHDDVDVPQVRELTVEDFERASLGDNYINFGKFEIQSSVAFAGSRALRYNASSRRGVNSNGGKAVYPQEGDRIVYYTYLTDADDVSRVRMFRSPGYEIAVDASSDALSTFTPADTGGDFSVISGSMPLNEWLRVEVDYGIESGGLRDVECRLFDSADNLLTTLTDETDASGGGGITFDGGNNAGKTTTIYWDALQVERREPEAAANTQKGRTQAGNNLTPTGGATTGPLEAPEGQHPERPVINVPVPSDMSAGDKVGYTFAVGEDRVATVEAEADGSGGTQNLSVNVNGALQAERTATGSIDYSGGGVTQEGQISPQLALGETFNISNNFEETNFGFGLITRRPSIGTALFEFDKFVPRVELIYDSGGKFTTTQGSSGNVNIFFNGSGELVVENQNSVVDDVRAVLFSE